MMGSMFEDKRMLLGLRFPCMCFLSCRKANPRAIPLAIFTRISNVRFIRDDDDDDDDPLPEQFKIVQNLLFGPYTLLKMLVR